MKFTFTIFACFTMSLATEILAADLNLSTNPLFETIGGKRYVIIKKDESVTFSASPSKTLDSLSWSFANGDPGTGTGNGPIAVTYAEMAVGKANAVKFTSSRTDEDDNNCVTTSKTTCQVIVPKVEYKQTGGSGSMTGKTDYPLDLAYEVYIGIVNANDVEFYFTPTSFPASEVKWSGLKTATGHSVSLTSPGSGNEILTVKSFSHTFKIKAATVSGVGKNGWGLLNLDKFSNVQAYAAEASAWAHAYPFGDTGVNENKTDAARHTYWNAITAAEYSSTVAIGASTAYEVSSLGNAGYARNSICMDMHNNAKGASIGSAAGVTTRSVLQADVLAALTAGDLLTLRRPSNSGQNELLIPSNQPYAP